MDISKFKGKFPDLHVHTGEGSLRDTGSICKELVKRESELGATAMAITDHGTMTAIQNFRVACEEVGIKPIYGCEFYTDIGDGERTHFILLAKNFDGYQAISKISTATAYNVHNDRPIATFDMFREYITNGIGKDNVIATSACMQGPLCRILLQNFAYDKDIAKIKKKRALEINPDSEIVLQANKEIEKLQTELEDATNKKNEVFELAKKTYKKELNKAYRSEDPELIAGAESLRDSVEAAVAQKPKVKSAETAKANELRSYKESVASIFKSLERYNKYTTQIKELESKKVSEKKAFNEAEDMLNSLVDIFGKENFYVELQNHGISEEIYAMPILAKIARKHKIPMVATNDVHYSVKDKAIVRQYNFVQYKGYGWKDMEPQDYELYIKDNEEMAEWLCRILPEDVVEEAIENTYKIADMCNTEFVIGKHYPKFPCKEGAKLHLRRLIQAGKKKIKNWTPVYQKRVQYELGVIEKMGFSDYLCIVEDFLNYARIIGKLDLDDPEFLNDPFNIPKLSKMAENEVGEGCGPGRGSAAGSLICYLVGITNIDPIENELLFERFLNPERVSMPDIDSDIPPNVRPFVIEYLKHIYGSKSVCQIMTVSYFGAKSAIQAAARVVGKRIGDDKAFVGLSTQLSKSIEDPKATVKEIEESLLAIDNGPKAKEIIEIAKAIEGLPSGYGTHAAGIIISDNEDVSDYTPLINISGAIDCQLDLNWVEPMGMLKLDLLGLRNLGIITDCEKAVLREYGVKLSMDTMPQEPEIYSEIFSKGNTNGVFQFESDGMKKTLTNFGPESIADLTILNAIFRPGPLQYIDSVTAVKKGEAEPKYIIPEMASVLDATYGEPIYQEQVMAIFNKFAGFSLGTADTIRKLMSKKKVEQFIKYKDDFVEGLIAHGASKSDAEKFWKEIVSFSEYAFNKSHARAYCETSYATAYLKYRYPEAYALGLLNYTSADDMPKIVLDTKNQGVSIKCPDINLSAKKFSLHGSDILFGLDAVPHVAANAIKIIAERQQNGKFKSFKDFLMRTNINKKAIENLIKAGAFDAFGHRNALLTALPNLLDLVKNIRKKEADILSMTEEKRIERAKATLDRLNTEFNDVEFTNTDSNRLQMLNDEKAMLGQYVSGHPMDDVKSDFTINSVKIGESRRAVAFATDFDYKVTKNGREMLNLTLSDGKTNIDAVMFPGCFDKFGADFKENGIYSVYGMIKEDGDKTQFVIDKVYPFKAESKPIIIEAPKGTDIWKSINFRLKVFKDDENGVPLSIYNNDTGKVIRTKLTVDKSIVDNVNKIKWIPQ
jgi:DNA polymerase-3 subunit alpha